MKVREVQSIDWNSSTIVGTKQFDVSDELCSFLSFLVSIVGNTPAEYHANSSVATRGMGGAVPLDPAGGLPSKDPLSPLPPNPSDASVGSRRSVHTGSVPVDCCCSQQLTR